LFIVNNMRKSSKNIAKNQVTIGFLYQNDKKRKGKTHGNLRNAYNKLRMEIM